MQAAETHKVAVITGSTSGIGEATAKLFGNKGYHVVVTGRNIERGEQVKQHINDNGGNADFFQADLTQQERAEELAAFAATLGELAVLVNCAGGNKRDMSLDDHFNINYKATRFVTLAALTYMKAGSSTVNVTSICSESKQAHEGGPYSDSKAAITSFTHGITKELALKGIRINIVAPGLTDTPDTANILPAERQELIDKMPLTNDFLRPEQIAQVIYDVSSWEQVTGATIVVDGGMTAVNG